MIQPKVNLIHLIRHRAMSTEINQARILTLFNPVGGKQTDWILSSFWISEVVLLKVRQLTFFVVCCPLNSVYYALS